jgi:protein-export membrane protein SecD
MINITRLQLWSALIACFLALVFAAPNFLPSETAKKLPWYVPQQQFSLGLDLQGGAYLLLEAEMKPVIDEHMRDLRNQVRQRLRDEKVRFENIRVVPPRGVTFRVDAEALEKGREIATRVTREFSSNLSSGLFSSRQDLYDVRAEGEVVNIRLTDAGHAAIEERIIEQLRQTVQRRIDPEEVREITVQRQGTTHIIVEVPGVSDTKDIRDKLGEVAKMTFHLLHPTNRHPSADAQPEPGYRILPGDRSMGEAATYQIEDEPRLDGKHLVDAQQSYDDQTRSPNIVFRLDTTGGRIFCRITQENVEKPFAIVLDNKVISAPNIKQAICGGNGVITGGFSLERATKLALLLRSGALPAPLKVVEERTVGPTLGADAITAGVWACLLGLALVGIYMISAYGLFGVFAMIALSFNLIILAAIMSLLQATLTLPGIAGIVLSLGMSVDANVLIYERMREEVRAGRTTLSAIDAGFRRAFTAISDSNITSIMAGMLLYLFGSGPVKGFGVTLAIGVAASFFTAIMLTRIQVVFWWRWLRPKTLPIVRRGAVAVA